MLCHRGAAINNITVRLTQYNHFLITSIYYIYRIKMQVSFFLFTQSKSIFIYTVNSFEQNILQFSLLTVMLYLGTVSGKPSKGRCVSLLLVFHFCSFSKHKTNHSMFITCGFVHTFSRLFFSTAMICNFIIFLCNNIFLVKWQGGTQADIVQVLPKKKL